MSIDIYIVVTRRCSNRELFGAFRLLKRNHAASVQLWLYLRRWQAKLRNRMTKADREKIKATAKAVVKKGKKKDGSTSVSDSQYLLLQYP